MRSQPSTMFPRAAGPVLAASSSPGLKMELLQEVPLPSRRGRPADKPRPINGLPEPVRSSCETSSGQHGMHRRAPDAHEGGTRASIRATPTPTPPSRSEFLPAVHRRSPGRVRRPSSPIARWRWSSTGPGRGPRREGAGAVPAGRGEEARAVLDAPCCLGPTRSRRISSPAAVAGPGRFMREAPACSSGPRSCRRTISAPSASLSCLSLARPRTMRRAQRHAGAWSGSKPSSPCMPTTRRRWHSAPPSWPTSTSGTGAGMGGAAAIDPADSSPTTISPVPGSRSATRNRDRPAGTDVRGSPRRRRLHLDWMERDIALVPLRDHPRYLALVRHLEQMRPDPKRAPIHDRAFALEDFAERPHWWDLAAPEAARNATCRHRPTWPSSARAIPRWSPRSIGARRAIGAGAGAELAGHGASRRNAGYLGRTLKRSFTWLEQHHGAEFATRVYRELDAARQWVSSLTVELGIDCHIAQCGRFIGATSEAHYKDLAQELEAMRRRLGFPYQMIAPMDVRRSWRATPISAARSFPTSARSSRALSSGPAERRAMRRARLPRRRSQALTRDGKEVQVRPRAAPSRRARPSSPPTAIRHGTCRGWRGESSRSKASWPRPRSCRPN